MKHAEKKLFLLFLFPVLLFVFFPNQASALVIWETKVLITSVKNSSTGLEMVKTFRPDVTIIGPGATKTNYTMRFNFTGSYLQSGNVTNAFTFPDSVGAGSGFTIYIHYKDGSTDYWFPVGNVGNIFSNETNRF